MALFEREMFAHEDDETGVFMLGLARALQTWAAMQDRETVTVAEAMDAFNTTAAVIREAVNDGGAYVFLVGPDDMPSKQLIELDGE